MYFQAATGTAETSRNGKELSRLVSAAVINRAFCDTLLADPATAMAAGFNGERFDLTSEEKDLVLSIQATCLTDFARQLSQQRNGHHGKDLSYGGNGSGHNHGHIEPFMPAVKRMERV